MDFGFVRIAAAVPTVKVADCKYNATETERLIKEADSKGVRIVVFPELGITGYTCGDLFAQQLLLRSAEDALQTLLRQTASLDIIAIIGMPVESGGSLLNAAVVIQHGRILGIVPKTYLPNYKEFYEKRWFASAIQVAQTSTTLCGTTVPMQAGMLFRTPETTFSIEICEDLWAPVPPGSVAALNGAEIIFNLSADDESTGKYTYLKELVSQQSSRSICGYAFSSCGFGESTTDVVFAGNAMLYEAGVKLAESKRFSLDSQLIISEIDTEKIRGDRRVNTTFAESRGIYTSAGTIIVDTDPVASIPTELTRKIAAHPFIPDALDERCNEIVDIQTAGLVQRLAHTKARTAVIGISGGLDSTLALLVTVRAFDKLQLPRTGIIGITMPGFGTTDRTHDNAVELMRLLGVTPREISIKAACIQHFKDIGQNPDIHDVTYENSQARERTQLLMDIANKENGMVIGTGDLSELALGWATYNGDHMSMYGVNAGVPKTLVRHLVRWHASQETNAKAKAVLLDIIDTPISPELIPADSNGEISQKTEDLVGPYDLHDFFLYNMLRNGFAPAKLYYLACSAFKGEFSPETIKHWLSTFCRRFFAQQFKRSCLPDGPKVGSIAISPRGDWRMPSDATSRLWLDECESL